MENSVLFKKVFVGENCVIKNSIILNDVYLGDNTHIENCIVESRDTILSLIHISFWWKTTEKESRQKRFRRSRRLFIWLTNPEAKKQAGSGWGLHFAHRSWSFMVQRWRSKANRASVRRSGWSFRKNSKEKKWKGQKKESYEGSYGSEWSWWLQDFWPVVWKHRKMTVL